MRGYKGGRIWTEKRRYNKGGGDVKGKEREWEWVKKKPMRVLTNPKSAYLFGHFTINFFMGSEDRSFFIGLFMLLYCFPLL